MGPYAQWHAHDRPSSSPDSASSTDPVHTVAISAPRAWTRRSQAVSTGYLPTGASVIGAYMSQMTTTSTSSAWSTAAAGSTSTFPKHRKGSADAATMNTSSTASPDVPTVMSG